MIAVADSATRVGGDVPKVGDGDQALELLQLAGQHFVSGALQDERTVVFESAAEDVRNENRVVGNRDSNHERFANPTESGEPKVTTAAPATEQARLAYLAKKLGYLFRYLSFGEGLPREEGRVRRRCTTTVAGQRMAIERRSRSGPRKDRAVLLLERDRIRRCARRTGLRVGWPMKQHPLGPQYDAEREHEQ